MKQCHCFNAGSRLRLALVAVLCMTMIGLAGAPARAKGEDASELLAKAAATMATVQSFKFELSTVRGQSTILRNLELAGIEGAVQRPDRFQATITARVAIVEVKVEVIGIGKQLWVTDPMAREKTYIQVAAGDDDDSAESAVLSALVNPDKLLLSAVGLVTNPTVDGFESIGGVRVTRVTGVVDLSTLEQFVSATPEAASDFLILGEMPVTIWIDADGYVLSMEIEGPLTTDESPDVVRRLDVFDIDEPVEIFPPEAET